MARVAGQALAQARGQVAAYAGDLQRAAMHGGAQRRNTDRATDAG